MKRDIRRRLNQLWFTWPAAALALSAIVAAITFAFIGSILGN